MDLPAAWALHAKTMNNKNVVTAKGIGKVVKSGASDLVILRDIDLEITRGEAVAVIGASGSGKSTLLAILADEPTGSLDADSGAGVIRLLFDLNREYGTTLVIVTHDESLAGRCGRMLRLAAGRIVA